MTVIDIHTHVFTEAMIASMQKEAPSLRLRLKPIDRDSAVLEIADIVQNPFPRKAWDLEQRFADMDAFKSAARTEEFMATGKDAMDMGVPFHVHFAEVSE